MENHLPMVRKLASKLARKLPPSIEYDDLVQQGSLGLLEAATKYRPEQNDNFRLYAKPRVLGSMLDSIRRRHWIAATAAPLEDVDESLDRQEIDRDFDALERLNLLRKAIAQLTSDKRRAIYLVYVSGLPERQAAQEMGVPVDRFEALHRQALQILKYKLAGLLVSR
jgi:RNA polymerase sigma factor (sigma-70 family)